jgi:hypothetical protein
LTPTLIQKTEIKFKNKSSENQNLPMMVEEANDRHPKLTEPPDFDQ